MWSNKYDLIIIDMILLVRRLLRCYWACVYLVLLCLYHVYELPRFMLVLIAQCEPSSSFIVILIPVICLTQLQVRYLLNMKRIVTFFLSVSPLYLTLGPSIETSVGSWKEFTFNAVMLNSKKLTNILSDFQTYCSECLSFGFDVVCWFNESSFSFSRSCQTD